MGMSARRAILTKIAGDPSFNLFRRTYVKTTTGAPTAARPKGTLCWNSYDSDAYICTVAAGTWVKINA